MKEPNGVWAAIITPFCSDGKINKEALRALIRRLIKEGIDGIFCFGTTGEFFTLNEQEKLEIIRTVIDECPDNVKVCAHTGMISTRDVIDLNDKMAYEGADYVSAVTPYYIKASQAELYEHYLAIASKSRVPLMIYNIPDRTGISISAVTLKMLKNHDMIAGIKDSSGNIQNITDYLSVSDDRFCVMSGADSLIFQSMLIGATGAVSGLANIWPDTVKNIYRLFCEGKFNEAANEQRKLIKLREIMSISNPVTVIKCALSLMGIDCGVPRAPVAGADEHTRGLIKDFLQAGQR